MQDLYQAGGVYAVMSELNKKGLLELDANTIYGVAMGEAIKGARVLDRKCDPAGWTPYSETGGIAVLFGSIAPNGAVVKRSAVAKEMLTHKGPCSGI